MSCSTLACQTHAILDSRVCLYESWFACKAPCKTLCMKLGQAHVQCLCLDEAADHDTRRHSNIEQTIAVRCVLQHPMAQSFVSAFSVTSSAGSSPLMSPQPSATGSKSAAAAVIAIRATSGSAAEQVQSLIMPVNTRWPGCASHNIPSGAARSTFELPRHWSWRGHAHVPCSG